MKSSTVKNTKIFKGAGMLIGFACGIAAGVVIFALTGKIEATLPLVPAFAVPLGICFERKFQGETKKAINPKTKNFFIILVAIGVIFLSGLYFFAKFI